MTDINKKQPLKKFKVYDPKKDRKPYFYSYDVQLKQEKFAKGGTKQKKLDEDSLLEFKSLPAKEIHKPLANVTPEEKVALKKYSHISSSMNDYLHNNHRGKASKSSLDVLEKHKSNIKNIDSAFTKKENHVGQNHIVYSGVPESPHKLFQLEASRTNTKPEEVTHVHAHLPAYTSTSTSKGIAGDFAMGEPTGKMKKISGMKGWFQHMNGRDIELTKKHILKIHVPEHHPSISIKSVSHHKAENEVLLHRGTRLKIHANPEIETDDIGHETHYWHADVIGHQLDPIR